jgi:hypothetical protein
MGIDYASEKFSTVVLGMAQSQSHPGRQNSDFRYQGGQHQIVGQRDAGPNLAGTLSRDPKVILASRGFKIICGDSPPTKAEGRIPPTPFTRGSRPFLTLIRHPAGAPQSFFILCDLLGGFRATESGTFGP